MCRSTLIAGNRQHFILCIYRISCWKWVENCHAFLATCSYLLYTKTTLIFSAIYTDNRCYLKPLGTYSGNIPMMNKRLIILTQLVLWFGEVCSCCCSPLLPSTCLQHFLNHEQVLFPSPVDVLLHTILYHNSTHDHMVYVITRENDWRRRVSIPVPLAC